MNLKPDKLFLSLPNIDLFFLSLLLPRLFLHSVLSGRMIVCPPNIKFRKNRSCEGTSKIKYASVSTSTGLKNWMKPTGIPPIYQLVVACNSLG